jgi:hypothetical protein
VAGLPDESTVATPTGPHCLGVEEEYGGEKLFAAGTIE